MADSENTLVMYRADETVVKPVKVACLDGLYPNKDADGVSIYSNSHFKTEDAAWQRLEANILAGISLSGSDVISAENLLLAAREKAASAAKRYAQLCQNRNDYNR